MHCKINSSSHIQIWLIGYIQGTSIITILTLSAFTPTPIHYITASHISTYIHPPSSLSLSQMVPSPPKKQQQQKTKNTCHSQQTGLGIILESVLRNTVLCLFTETKWQTFCGIPGFYLTSGAVDYMAVIFCALLVAVKCKVFITTSTREYIRYTLGQQPSWHVPPYFRQISHASPLHVPKNLSERGLFPCVFSWVLCDNWLYLMGQLFLYCNVWQVWHKSFICKWKYNLDMVNL